MKRKDTRDHFGFENDHVLHFASRAVFGEMFKGKKINSGWNFSIWSRALFTGNSIFLDLFTGRKKVSRAAFYRNENQAEWSVDLFSLECEKLKDTFDHRPTPFNPSNKTFSRKKMINLTFFWNPIFVHYDKYNTSKNNWTPTGYATHLPSGDKIASKRVKIYSLKSRKDTSKRFTNTSTFLGFSKKMCHELLCGNAQ